MKPQPGGTLFDFRPLRGRENVPSPGTLRDDAALTISISHTTRPQRPGEQDMSITTSSIGQLSKP